MVIPEYICGVDSDEVLAFTTTKKVWIRDRWLGFVYYTLVFFICLWVFGYQILYHNEQFSLEDVKGLARMWATHPLRNQCNPFMPHCQSDYQGLEELPYCEQFHGIGLGKKKGPCRHKDMISLGLIEEGGDKIFLPTSVEMFTEKRICDPQLNENGCENEYEDLLGTDCIMGSALCRKRANKSDQFYYVADVKDFVIQFTTSYEQGEVHGISMDHPGFYGICEGSKREPNVTMTWEERKEFHDKHSCNTHELTMVQLPCGRDTDCARVRKFDMSRDTGIDESIDKIKKDIDDVVEEEKGAGAAQKLDENHWKQVVATAQKQDSAAVRPASKSVQGASRSSSFLGTDLDSSASLDSKQKPYTTEENAKKAQEQYYPTPDQYQGPWGDNFKLGRLIELAGADLDRDLNLDGWTTRQAGTVIEVRAVFNNLYPFLSTFGFKQVEYHYEVTELPLPYLSRTDLAKNQPPDYPNTRVYEVKHGVLVWFKVSGKFGVFSMPYFLIMLVTAFALFSSATAITDFVAIYLHNRKDNYFQLKYEISPDFSGHMWKCPKCGYLNWKDDMNCRGIPAWACQQTAPRCNEPRPIGWSSPPDSGRQI